MKNKMKNKLTRLFLMAAAVLLALAVQSCLSAASYRDISEIQGKDWILEQITTGKTTVKINRTDSAAEVYTLSFDTLRISGAAAPNRYFGPYTSGDRQTIKLEPAGITMMAPLFERSDLREQDYFNYLEKVWSWDIKNGKLILNTFDQDGKKAVLIFG